MPAADPRPQLDLALNVVALTATLVDVPSESGAEGPLADAVEAALSALPHLQVRRDGDTVVASTATGTAERVLLGGHLDTVPAAGNLPSTLVAAGDPVPVVGADGATTATDDRLYGLGSCDMKGGVAVMLRCAAEVPAPGRDVTYVFYESEEVDEARNGLFRLARTRPDWLVADFAVLLEPSDAGVEAGCQGTLRALVTTSGRRAHSARSWLGDNAVHRAGPVLARLAAYQPRRVVVDGLEYREGLNATVIEGGSAANVIPDECVVTVNYRYAPTCSPAQAEAHVREVLAGIDARIEVVDNAAGAMPGLDRPAAADFVAAVGAVPRPKFGWTDVARFAGLGIPAVNYGPGSPTLAHTRDEHVPLAQLRDVEARLRAWLVRG